MDRTQLIFLSLLGINFLFFVSVASANSSLLEQQVAEEHAAYELDSPITDDGDAQDKMAEAQEDLASQEDENNKNIVGENAEDAEDDTENEDDSNFIQDIKKYSDNFSINNLGNDTPYAKFGGRYPSTVDRSGPELASEIENIEESGLESVEIDTEE